MLLLAPSTSAWLIASTCSTCGHHWLLRAPLIPSPPSIASRVRIRQGVNDSTLPLAHTCFFNLELPEYSKYDTMVERVLTAVHCSVGYYGIL
jgi:hypothetical protein